MSDSQSSMQTMESVVPEIGPFYDGILKNHAHCPTAEQSLQELRRIRSNLTDLQLEHPRLAFFWENGERLSPKFVVLKLTSPPLGRLEN
jgi:hypothetical protein